MTATDDILQIIQQLADQRDTFTTDDIRPLLPEGMSPKSIPAAVGKARRDGLVEEVDRIKSQVPERKGSLVAVLRGSGSQLAAVKSSSLASGGSDLRLAGAANEIVALKDYLEACGFIIGVEELSAFLLFLSSRTWVILAGPSGTGKSSLVRHLSAALGGDFHDVQVKPNWISSEDSLGYYSEIGKSFSPGIVLRALSAAQNDSDRVHFIRFDEMNLASPEYYLAELLSAGESWRILPNGRQASDVLQLPPAPDGVSLPEVRLHDNAFLVGTVNVDETTRSLSPKVLDRGAVMELHNVDLFANPGEGTESTQIDAPQIPAVRALLADRPHSVRALAPDDETVHLVADLLSRLSDSSRTLGGPIGYRQRDALLSMLVLAERHLVTDILSRDSLLDIGLRSCVLPKWQGSTAAAAGAVRNALEVLIDETIPADVSTDSLQTLGAASRFPRSAERLIEMLRQFATFGYFSAW